MIAVEHLRKRYFTTVALRDVTLSVAKGRLVGVLGENGSGKSTLFRILAGVTRPTGGVVRIGGQEVGLETRRLTAYLPEVDPFYRWMRASEQLDFLAPFYPGWDPAKSRALLQALNLDGDRKVGEMSHGQRARLKVAAAFSWPSQVVLMDEPFGGIDPPSRRRILESLVGEFRYGEQVILVSTHLVSEIEEFVDDVCYLKKGEIALWGEADALRNARGQSLSGIFEEVAS